MPPHATPPKVRACSPPLPASLPPCTTPGTHAASATRTQPVAALGGTLAGALLRRHRPARLAGRRVCDRGGRSEEHTSELQSLMRISYAVFCLKKKKTLK